MLSVSNGKFEKLPISSYPKSMHYYTSYLQNLYMCGCFGMDTLKNIIMETIDVPFEAAISTGEENELYNIILKSYQEIDCENCAYIKEKIILFNNTYSRGTTHAFVATYSYLYQYVTNNYQDRIAISEKAHKSVLELIEYIIPKDKIFFLKDKTTYFFEDVKLLTNYGHYFTPKAIYAAQYLFKNFYVKDVEPYRKICSIKTEKNNNLTKLSFCTYQSALKFSKINGYTLLCPEDFNEVDWINYLYRAEEVVLSWGTSFTKNYIFLQNCRKLTVLLLDEASEKSYAKEGKGYVEPHIETYFVRIEPDKLGGLIV